MNTLVSEGGVQFYVTPTYTQDDLHRVQAKSIEMFRTIVEILERHDIAYTLGYGSLLGQIRHNGYIPWDDDVDLFIMREDYGRAILHLRREMPDDLILHDKRNDPVYWVTWVKVRDLHSHTVESMWKIDRKFRYHGVAIDLIGVDTSTVGKHRHAPEIKRLRTQLRKTRATHATRRRSRRLLETPRFMVSVFVLRSRIAAHRLLRKWRSRKLLVAAAGTVIERTFHYDDMFPIRSDGPLFEGMKVRTPRNPAGILRSMYGDFMKLPPLEDRVPHFESAEFYETGDAPEGPGDGEPRGKANAAAVGESPRGSDDVLQAPDERAPEVAG